MTRVSGRTGGGVVLTIQELHLSHANRVETTRKYHGILPDDAGCVQAPWIHRMFTRCDSATTAKNDAFVGGSRSYRNGTRSRLVLLVSRHGSRSCLRRSDPRHPGRNVAERSGRAGTGRVEGESRAMATAAS